MADAVVGGASGMLLGAMLVAGRGQCATAIRELVRVPPRWLPFLSGGIAGSGFAALVAGAWLLHRVAS